MKMLQKFRDGHLIVTRKKLGARGKPSTFAYRAGWLVEPSHFFISNVISRSPRFSRYESSCKTIQMHSNIDELFKSNSMWNFTT